MRSSILKVLPIFVLGLVLFAAILSACATAPGGAGAPEPEATEAPAAEGPTGTAVFMPEPTSPAALPTSLPVVLLPTPTAMMDVAEPAAVIPESRMLTLEFPPSIRAGDSDIVRLTLEVDDQGNITPTASIEGNVTRGEVVAIPNVFATHNVMAEARLDMAGVEVRPSETVSEPLLPGQKVIFFWSVRPEEVGTFKGTVWFYLRYLPKAGGPDVRQAISSQMIEIDSVTLLGLRATPARWLGFLGTVLSSILGAPFAEDILKMVWKRVRK